MENESIKLLSKTITKAYEDGVMVVSTAKYTELMIALEKLRPSVPDSETGLIPCGCGGKLDVDYEHYDIESSAEWFVECLSCSAKVKARTKQNALEKWNKHMEG